MFAAGEKPTGAATEVIVLPWASGRNSTGLDASPALKTTGEDEIVPMRGSELETSTLTGPDPPRNCICERNAKVDGSRIAGVIWRVVAGDSDVVVSAPELSKLEKTKPDGASITVLA